MSGDKESPKSLAVSLIICSRNRPELLMNAISSVLTGTSTPDEVIVIDQSDVANKVLENTAPDNIHYVWSCERGVARARNHGIRIARNHLLAFIDDDVVVYKSWLECLVRALKNDEHKVATGMVRSLTMPDRTSFAPSTRTDSEPRDYSGMRDHDMLYTGNMAIYKSTFGVTGMFDERLGPGTSFPAAEDNDLCLRILRAGFTIRYVPDAVVDHLAWRSESERSLLQWRYGRGQGACYAKHLSLREARLWRRLAADLTRSAGGGFRFWSAEARSRFYFAAGMIAGLVQWKWRNK